MVLRNRGKKMDLLSLKKKLLARETADVENVPSSQFERTQIATCIVLLEIARSDDEFSGLEKDIISGILKRDHQISEEAIEELMEVATRTREDSVDLWEFTNLINEQYSREEKMAVMESAWRVIYADDKLDMYEDYLVHKLAKLLRLDHRDLIRAKLKVLEEKTE